MQSGKWMSNGKRSGFSWMHLPHHKYRENPDFLQIPENLLTGFKTQYVRLLIIESKNKKGNPNGLPQNRILRLTENYFLSLKKHDKQLFPYSEVSVARIHKKSPIPSLTFYIENRCEYANNANTSDSANTSNTWFHSIHSLDRCEYANTSNGANTW